MVQVEHDCFNMGCASSKVSAAELDVAGKPADVIAANDLVVKHLEETVITVEAKEAAAAPLEVRKFR